MLEVYKKVEKTKDNPYGVVLIQNIEELNRPFLLCLSAQDTHPKSIFGMIKQGAKAARVNTTDEFAAGFKIDEFPIDFLGVKFLRDAAYKNNYEEITDKLIYPYLMGVEVRPSVIELKKRARRINIMTYCDGTFTYSMVEKRLISKLQYDGYSIEDIESILSQVSLTCISTMVELSNIKASTVGFIDVNDEEIATERTARYQNILQEKNKRALFGHLGRSNNLIYIFKGSGKHSLKEYFNDDTTVKVAISAILGSFLESSVENEKSKELIPLYMRDIVKLLKYFGDENKKPADLLNTLDSILSYDNAPKYTREEAKLRQELNASYMDYNNLRIKQKSIENQRNNLLKKIDALIKGIRTYSSETTMRQILCSARMLQSKAGEDPLQERSDKKIREEYEKLLIDSIEPSEGPKL